MIHQAEITAFPIHQTECELCIVGGGISGMLAALAAARHGRQVVLMQDRPVLGGNASSEVRMWIRGAKGVNMRETGILEELALENLYRNPKLNYSVWDSVMYGKLMTEKNITLIMNCSCLDAEMDHDRILSVTGWQTTTQSYHKVKAKIFADCSGDSILAPLTGAEWRMGRESCHEFNEDIAPEVSDEKTMGMSCLIQARETAESSTFIAPEWAYHFTKEDFENKINFDKKDSWAQDNFWWLELGGLVDSIADTEQLRDELIRTAYGVWDFIKNSGECEADHWELNWIGFLPGKRESRRYVGDILLNQNDVRSEGRFEDIVAYGGWSMDDHNPKGFLTTEKPTIFHPAPSPYGIPYRCLYSKNISNLMFAGRNISATHSAMSSTRVMATCGILGQALGTAAAIALRENETPRGIYERHMDELQQTLLADDCYIPWVARKQTALMKKTTLQGTGDVEKLVDGVSRPVKDRDHAYVCRTDEKIIMTLDEESYVKELRVIVDSDLNRETFPENTIKNWRLYPMHCNLSYGSPQLYVPKTILKGYEVYADGQLLFTEQNNYQRLVRIPVNKKVKEICFIPKQTWGSDIVRLFAMELMDR